MRLSASRRTAVLTVTVALAVLASACGGGEAETVTDPDPPEPDRKVELTIATFNDFGYQDLYGEYEAENPNVKITERRSATVDQHVKNLDTNLASGSGLADIEAMEVGWIYGYLGRTEQFVDLRQYGADELKGRWLEWKTAGGSTTDGKIIGYGADIGPEAICYRKDLFAKAGLPTDRAQVAKLFPDWASYFAVGRRFKARMPGSAWYDSAVLTWDAMRNQLIQAYYSNEDRYLGEENDLLKQTWDHVTLGSRDGLSAGLPAGSDQWVRGFKTDAFATMACPGWLLGTIQANAGAYGEGKWDVADVFPGGGGNRGGSYLTVPVQSTEPEEAAKLAAWLTAPEQQVKAFGKAGSFPSAVEAHEDSRVKDQVDAYFNGAPVGQIFVNRARDVILKQHKGPRDGDVNRVFTDALRRVDEGRQRPAAAWAQALREADRIAGTPGDG